MFYRHGSDFFKSAFKLAAMPLSVFCIGLCMVSTAIMVSSASYAVKPVKKSQTKASAVASQSNLNTKKASPNPTKQMKRARQDTSDGIKTPVPAKKSAVEKPAKPASTAKPKAKETDKKSGANVKKPATAKQKRQAKAGVAGAGLGLVMSGATLAQKAMILEQGGTVNRRRPGGVVPGSEQPKNEQEGGSSGSNTPAPGGAPVAAMLRTESNENNVNAGAFKWNTEQELELRELKDLDREHLKRIDSYDMQIDSLAFSTMLDEQKLKDLAERFAEEKRQYLTKRSIMLNRLFTGMNQEQKELMKKLQQEHEKMRAMKGWISAGAQN